MSFAISMQAPLHSPLARSFWKYGSSPGSAAMRSVLVRRTRSNVDSLADCARAVPKTVPTGRRAAPPAKARRPRLLVIVGVSQCLVGPILNPSRLAYNPHCAVQQAAGGNDERPSD